LGRVWLNNACRIDFAEIGSPVLLRLMCVFELEKSRSEDFSWKSIVDFVTRLVVASVGIAKADWAPNRRVARAREMNLSMSGSE